MRFRFCVCKVSILIWSDQSFVAFLHDANAHYREKLLRYLQEKTAS